MRPKLFGSTNGTFIPGPPPRYRLPSLSQVLLSERLELVGELNVRATLTSELRDSAIKVVHLARGKDTRMARQDLFNQRAS
jgi:hypothetical protein